MPLQLNSDLLPVVGQGRIGAGPTECSVKYNQRLACAVKLVIHLDTAHDGVLARHLHGWLVLVLGVRCASRQKRECGEHSDRRLGHAVGSRKGKDTAFWKKFARW